MDNQDQQSAELNQNQQTYNAWQKPETYNSVGHFFNWYFSDAPKLFWAMIKAILVRAIDNFSLEYLLKTLFAPWKRDIVGGTNLSLQQKIQIWSWNLISRFFGFLIRSITIIFGSVFIAILTLVLLSMYIFWFLMPIAIVILIVLGLMAIFQI